VVSGSSDFLPHLAVPDTNALYGFVIDRLTERHEVADVNTSIVYEHVRRPYWSRLRGDEPRHPDRVMRSPARHAILAPLRARTDLAGTTAAVEQGRRVADAVYGTILVLAVVAALSQDKKAGPGEIAAGALTTSLVFWIVHVYAQVLSRRTAGDTMRTRELVSSAARQEWPLVAAALAPLVPLVLGAIGVFQRSTSITLSIAVGLADLAAWGYLAGRAMGQATIKSVISALVAVGLGLLMVLLKNLVH